MAGLSTDGAKGILSYFTRHRTAANLVLVLMLAAGLIAAPKMRAQFFPDVVVDTLSLSYTWTGAGAEDVDAAIVQVVEPVLLTVEGVTGSSATSTEGRASIRLEFEPGYDMEQAAKDVQEAADAITNLPEEAEEANVRSGSWSDRVTDVVITGPIAPAQLGRFADELDTRRAARSVPLLLLAGMSRHPPLSEHP